MLVYLLLLISFSSSQYSDSLARYLNEYSKLSYCQQNDITLWKCDSCDPDEKLEDLRVFYSQKTRAQFLSGYDPKLNRIIIAFRGTDNVANQIADLSSWMIDSDYCENCKVHNGFNLVFDSEMKNYLLSCIEQLKSKYSQAKIYITGHSMGAVLAQMATLYLIKARQHPDYLYHFASPRWANTQLAAYFNSQISINYRITHQSDTVPHIFAKLLGYEHTGMEVHYFNDIEYKVHEDYKDVNNRYGFTLNPFRGYQVHVTMFGKYSGCGKGSKEYQNFNPFLSQNQGKENIQDLLFYDEQTLFKLQRMEQ